MTTNFLGLEIQGEINKSRSDSVQQRPIEELTPVLQAALDDDRIEAIRWRQYTPYFNDGEECVFSLREVYFQLAEADRTEGDYSDGFQDCFDLKGSPVYSLCNDIAAEFGSGAFNDALFDLFGDHATVTIVKGENIQVEYYNHE